eukprot:TRINITY_DN329_c2_g2_i1.p1 TRINITY_DN329_c2_g2~~TRINITY_DN329_c2_g2_i1.p1  ORF type:complete len:181 (+),score=21.81 TRINITY_DN329_c2_g2_i1:42-584(+)
MDGQVEGGYDEGLNYEGWYKQLWFLLALGLLIQEGFHCVAHLKVLFRIKPMERDTLKERGWYFLWEGFCHIVPYFVHGRFLVYSLFQFVAHMYYVLFWNKHHYAIRIRDWSTKEYTGRWITPDWFLTWSDIIGHALNVYALSAITGPIPLMFYWVPFPLYNIVTTYLSRESTNNNNNNNK